MKKPIGISMTQEELTLVDKICMLDKRDRSSVVAIAISDYAKKIGASDSNA